MCDRPQMRVGCLDHLPRRERYDLIMQSTLLDQLFRDCGGLAWQRVLGKLRGPLARRPLAGFCEQRRVRHRLLAEVHTGVQLDAFEERLISARIGHRLEGFGARQLEHGAEARDAVHPHKSSAKPPTSRAMRASASSTSSPAQVPKKSAISADASPSKESRVRKRGTIAM